MILQWDLRQIVGAFKALYHFLGIAAKSYNQRRRLLQSPTGSCESRQALTSNIQFARTPETPRILMHN